MVNYNFAMTAWISLNIILPWLVRLLLDLLPSPPHLAQPAWCRSGKNDVVKMGNFKYTHEGEDDSKKSYERGRRGWDWSANQRLFSGSSTLSGHAGCACLSWPRRSGSFSELRGSIADVLRRSRLLRRLRVSHILPFAHRFQSRLRCFYFRINHCCFCARSTIYEGSNDYKNKNNFDRLTCRKYTLIFLMSTCSQLKLRKIKNLVRL